MIRLFDVFWSSLGLALLAPGFLVVAGLIKWDDGGPVFYQQVRVGRHGKPFRILKFRTMSQGSDQAGLPLTVGHDARVTRVGTWLRRWKIDELPQLVNVWRGDMSLVGPRPEVPRYVGLYDEAQAQVLRLRPGITDPASIAYRCESDILRRSEDPEAFYVQHILPNKIRINLEYAANATLATHVQVILATLGLLPAPVRVRQAGDLRAFDRIALEKAAQVAVGTGPPRPIHPINISLGGMLVEPAGDLSVGSHCAVSLVPMDPNLGLISTEGVVIRANAQETAIRFSRPLATRIFNAVALSA